MDNQKSISLLAECILGWHRVDHAFIVDKHGNPTWAWYNEDEFYMCSGKNFDPYHDNNQAQLLLETWRKKNDKYHWILYPPKASWHGFTCDQKLDKYSSHVDFCGEGDSSASASCIALCTYLANIEGKVIDNNGEGE